MIALYLGIGDGDVNQMKFENKIELVDYIREIKSYKFNCVWLLAVGNELGNIFVTEKLDFIELSIETGIVDYENSSDLDCCNIHLHEYESYEDAYKVAIDMREGNPLCY